MIELSNYVDPEILSYTVADNTVENYLIALVVFLVAFVVLKTFKFIIINRLKHLSKRTETDLDDIIIKSIDRIGWSFYIAVSLYVALQFLAVPDILGILLFYIIVIAGTYYAVLIVQSLIEFGTNEIVRRQQKEDKTTDTSIIELLGQIVKYSMWIVAVLLILSNLGYDISPMIAGLGVGGIAIAFALQNVLTDVFASFSIYFDKPFKKGDFIIIGSDMGTVEKIGIKSTRIRSLKGQELVVSNKELTETRVHNYKKMKKRRIAFSFGVTYETPSKKLKKIPGITKSAIDGIELAEFNRTHFKDFGDSSLNYEVVYYVLTGDYRNYMDIQQQINLSIVEKFEKEKIEMAYPTRTLYLHKVK